MKIKKIKPIAQTVVPVLVVALVVGAFLGRRTRGTGAAPAPHAGDLPEVFRGAGFSKYRLPASVRGESRGDAVERRADSGRALPPLEGAGSLESSKIESRALAMARAERAPDSETITAGEGRSWRIREDLVAIDAEEARSRGLARGQDGVRFIGGRAIVAREREGDGVRGFSGGGTVVEEVRTGRIGVLTGNVVVRLGSWTERDAFLGRNPSTVKGQSAGIRMLVVRPSAENAELAGFAEGLRADPAVESAEIEVIDRQVEPK